MSSPRSVVNETFFQQLWPLILDVNLCDTHSTNTTEFFMPKKKFDAVWTHEYLASRKYGEYEAPIQFFCPPCISAEVSQSDFNATVPIQLDEERYTRSYSNARKIPTLDEQFAEIDRRENRRQTVLMEFRNRRMPWYAHRSNYGKEFISDLQKVFTKPFDRELLYSIHNFKCKFMIINVGPGYSLRRIESWLRYCKYVKIVLIVRSQDIAEKLAILNPSLYPLFFEDVWENTWQEELTRALNAGIIYAQDVKIMTNCAMSFVYVFSSRADLDILDTYRVLKRA